VQQVAATGKLPLELGGNIHLFRQRWWKGTFIPALLTPPPNGSSLPLAHVKLGELLVDRGMLAAQQVSLCGLEALACCRPDCVAVGRVSRARAAARARPQAAACHGICGSCAAGKRGGWWRALWHLGSMPTISAKINSRAAA
jgi:hypothetical protein